MTKKVLEKGQWSAEKAWEWYNAQPWIRGYNGYPSNCVNRIAMWQEHKHEEVFEQIEREFALARETGFNSVRAIIQFECWYYQHDSFMKHLEEYFTLADKHGLKVMLTLGNDCTVPKADFKPVKFGEQNIDWGYHSGIKKGPHAAGYDAPGYCLLDEPEFEGKYYEMVDEIAAKYAKDDRLIIWDVWNEPGNGRRKDLSLKPMEKYFEIIRSHDPIQPLTADVWKFDENYEPFSPIERRAIELSDVITFHNYKNFEYMVCVIDKLKKHGRPLINNEWLNRIEHNDVFQMFPLFYLERIGSYHWGLIQGYSQTYEPWGRYYNMLDDPNIDVTKLQHDLYRFSGYPYDKREIDLIKRFCARADADFASKNGK